MTIQSIELEIDLTGSFANLNQVIETKLQQWGEPLRWAITSIDPVTNIAQIEAIVIGE
jgi:hypothetical protein